MLTPHAAPGPEVEFAAIAPGQLVISVARVTSTTGAGASGDPTSTTALRTLTAPAHLDRAADELLTSAIDVIGYASTTSAYVIGFEAETALLSRLAQLTSLPVASTCSSAIRALHVLAVERVALIGAPWFDPVSNELGAAYFARQGFHVVSSESAELSQRPRDIEPAAVLDWTSCHIDDSAEAVFIGGNGFRAAGAIDDLEATIDRPVLTSNQVLLWHLLAYANDRFRVKGYGRLFAHKP